MATFHLEFSFHFMKKEEVAGCQIWLAEPVVRGDFSGVGRRK